MNAIIYPHSGPWSSFHKILFRFFFIFLLLIIAPWTWLDSIPGVSYITQYYYQSMDWAVETSNKYIFHVKDVLVPLNGSGDTSYGWAQLWMLLCIAIFGCIIWSLLDSKRCSYLKMDYWLRTFTRYYISLVALSYGINKLFLMQMPFPSQSQLATPLGDLLPMRFSWFFIGYSGPYQFFSGAAETIAGLLLLNRKTVTLGLMFAAGIFLNVMVLNLCYDIPVKIYSMQIEMMCVFLLVCDYKRLFSFFIYNNETKANSSYDIIFPKKWMRMTRLIFKLLFVILTAGLTTYIMLGYYKNQANLPEPKPFNEGVYDIKTFAVNKDTLPALISDTLRWQDIIFEKGNYGSINTKDTLFRQRYGRGYFSFEKDTTQQNTIGIIDPKNDSLYLFTMRYEFTDSNHVKLWSKIRTDSIYLELVKSNRHFQLAEKQFHWLSEYNR